MEDALRASHGQHSRDTHPLLTDELLKIKAPLQREIPLDRDGPVKTGSPGAPGHNGIKEENNEVVDSFGSLSIGLGGKTKYYGSFANSWVSPRPLLLIVIVIFGTGEEAWCKFCVYVCVWYETLILPNTFGFDWGIFFKKNVVLPSSECSLILVYCPATPTDLFT